MKKSVKMLFLVIGFIFLFNVSSVSAKTLISNLYLEIELPSYGELLYKYMPSTIDPSPKEGLFYYYDESYWERYNESTQKWERITNTDEQHAVSGKYRYNESYYHLEDDEDYNISDEIEVMVNGDKWNDFYIKHENGLEYIQIVISDITFTSPEDMSLTYYENDYNNLPNLVYSGESIQEFSILRSIDGGVRPYKVVKESGPDWLNVSEDGLISGTPNKLIDIYKEENENAVLKVIDNIGNNISIPIDCGTTIDKDNMYVPRQINIKGIDKPKQGTYVFPSSMYAEDEFHRKMPFTIITGSSYARRCLNIEQESCNIYLWNNFEYKIKYISGLYQLIVKMYINPTNGIKITDDTKILLDGQPLLFNVSNDSLVTVKLPAYLIESDFQFLIHNVEIKSKCPVDDDVYISNYFVRHGEKIANIEMPTCKGYLFQGWYIDDDFKKKFDVNTLINQDTVLYSKWGQDISKSTVMGIVDKTYNGKYQSQNVKVIYNDKELIYGADYTISYKNNKNAGISTVVLTGNGSYAGTIQKQFKINKASNPLVVKTSKKTVKKLKVKRKKQVVKAITVRKNQGKVKYYKQKRSSSKLIINKTTGKITVKKGTKKGTYKIRVKVVASGNGNYNSGYKVVTVKVRVK